LIFDLNSFCRLWRTRTRIIDNGRSPNILPLVLAVLPLVLGALTKQACSFGSSNQPPMRIRSWQGKLQLQ
jgi:hypothetical protein